LLFQSGYPKTYQVREWTITLEYANLGNTEYYPKTNRSYQKDL